MVVSVKKRSSVGGFAFGWWGLLTRFKTLRRLVREFPMRALLLLLFAVTAVAQSQLEFQNSRTTESLRGVSAVSAKIAWASGTHGTYLRTVDGGKTWVPKQVPDAEKLDFRGVVAFSADEAFLMSSGPGDQSRIYHTSGGGQHWQLEFTNTNPKGFFDSIAFWDPKHGVVWAIRFRTTPANCTSSFSKPTTEGLGMSCPAPECRRQWRARARLQPVIPPSQSCATRGNANPQMATCGKAKRGRAALQGCAKRGNPKGL